MAAPNHVLAKIERRAATLLNSRRLQCRPERPVVSCTFDDFPASAWHVGGPILAERDARATYYVCGGLLGQVFDGLPLATAADLRALAAAGHEIGCHTHRHVCLQGASARQIEAEFDKNLEAVRDAVPGTQLQTFAYPYGATGFVGKRAVGARFEAARSVWRGTNFGKVDLMQLRTRSLSEVAKDLNTARRVIEETKRVNGWLVIYSHDVDPTPSAGGCTPEQLARILDVARDAGCDLLPVADALATMRAAMATST